MRGDKQTQMNETVSNKASEEASLARGPKSGFFRRFSKLILLLLLVAAPFCFKTSAKVLTPGDMSSFVLDVSHWLPKNSRIISDLEKFSEVVGKERQNVVRISWPMCFENDHRIEQYVAALQKEFWPEDLKLLIQQENPASAERALPNNPLPVFTDIETLDSVMQRMREADPRLTDQQIKRQLSGVLLGDNGTTCVLAMLATRKPEARQYALETVYRVADKVPELGRTQTKAFGGPVYTGQIDQSGKQLAEIITPISALLSLLAAWYCLRNFWLILCVCGNAFICTSWAVATLGWTDAPIDPLLMLLPAFWLVMSMSTGIHFVNYFLDATRIKADKPNQHDIALEAVKMAWRPTCLAVLTTCVGLGSLCTSDILPVWYFGFQAVIGLLACLAVMFLLLPSLLTICRNRLPSAESEAEKSKVWIGRGEAILGLGRMPAILLLGLLLVTAVGFSRLEFSNKVSDQFKNKVQLRKDALWFEEEIGPLLPFEVLVRFDNESSLRNVDRLNFVGGLQKQLEQLPYPCKTISATSIIAELPKGSGVRQATMRAVAEARLRKHLESMQGTGMVIQEENAQLWRLTVLAYDSSDASMNQYFRSIRQSVDNYVTESKSDLPESEKELVRVSYAGLGARMATITQKLGGGLMNSCFYTILLISLIVVFALRSIPLGLTAMLPNVFPVVISFGAFGWFSPRLDIGSIMTASIAMGIAVDDTIHFLYWFRKGVKQQLSKVDSIRLAIHRCGRAIFTTSLVCGLGFVVFTWCDFMPAARFGGLLFLMLGAALIGDLLFLPALLLLLPQRLLGIARETKTIETDVITPALNSRTS